MVRIVPDRWPDMLFQCSIGLEHIIQPRTDRAVVCNWRVNIVAYEKTGWLIWCLETRHRTSRVIGRVDDECSDIKCKVDTSWFAAALETRMTKARDCWAELVDSSCSGVWKPVHRHHGDWSSVSGIQYKRKAVRCHIRSLSIVFGMSIYLVSESARTSSKLSKTNSGMSWPEWDGILWPALW